MGAIIFIVRKKLLVIGFIVCGLPTLMEAAESPRLSDPIKGPGASVEFTGACQVDTFREGALLFTDRKYVLKETPDWLREESFLRGSIDRSTFEVTAGGVLALLTPDPGREGAATQSEAIESLGFRWIAKPETFQLYGDHGIDRVRIYQKQVSRGERFELGKWTVVLGFEKAIRRQPKPWSDNAGERLYNGIVLPEEWPPRHLDPHSRELVTPPYLESPPEVINIDVGRQLFVDDFLIESTSLRREFHKAQKFEGNPILKPETELELNSGDSPVACPFSDGVFYDPRDRLFKMWYHAGWFDGTAYAISRDGIHWERPKLDVVPETNRVLAPREDFRRDGVSLWLDQDTANPEERYKMFLYARSSTHPPGGRVLSSPDGIHFTERSFTGPLGDNTTYFYNPFRKKWVFSIRSSRNRRQRDYWENSDFFAVEDGRWTPEPVYWCGADDLDKPDPEIGEAIQLYKVDAVGYESVMLGLLGIHYGPPNEVCTRGKFPKLTEMELAFSRDGFHWDRTWRESFIPASRKEGDWERGYIHSAGGCCLIVGDEIFLYYGAFSGESPNGAGGIYAGAATGLARLRRDGFASMDAGEKQGELVTRPVVLPGKHGFVNVDAPAGKLRAEILDLSGQPIEPFTCENCLPVSEDSTMASLEWKGAEDLSALGGRPVRFRFELEKGKLYSFWVSPDESGASHGFVAAGGPGFTGPRDTVGRLALDTGNRIK